MNKCCLTGRITKDLEIKYTSNEVAILNFSIAVQRKFKDVNGDYQADFINCVAYRKTAEIIEKYFNKGDMIGISGRIQTGSYENQNGEIIYTTNVIIDDFDFLQTKKNNDNTNYHKEVKKQNTVDPFEDFGEQIEITDDFLD